MNRRVFLAAALTFVIAPTIVKSRKKYVFKIRTKNRSIISNIVVEAKDIFAATVVLKKRYPGCEILEGKEK